MAFLLGLTGNIACGKSTVGRALAERYGADYVDADRVVHQLYAAGTPETLAIAERFGVDLLQQDGTIDRRRLGDLVMADPTARQDLETLLSPSIRRRILDAIAASDADVVVLDAIRLYEAGLAEQCDAVWVVTCEREGQIQRLMQTRGFSHEQAALRVDAQAPQAEKAARADAVLHNAGTLVDLERQVGEAWDRTPGLGRLMEARARGYASG